MITYFNSKILLIIQSILSTYNVTAMCTTVHNRLCWINSY